MNEACGMEAHHASPARDPGVHRSDILEIGSPLTEARRARDFAEQVVGDGKVVSEQRELVLIAVSELVTNALVHGAAPRRLLVVRHHEDVDVVVRDGSPDFPHMRAGADSEPGGHGLRVVDRIAERWGVRRVDSGKEVWCRIHLDVSP